MRSTNSSPSIAELLDRWQRQFVSRKQPCRMRAGRLAALGYLTNGPVRQGLVPIEQLLLVVLHAELPQPATKLAGFSAERIEWGVEWGGPARNRFAKDLALEPKIGARGPRLDLRRVLLVQLALQLERELSRHARFPRLPIARRFRLPPLWAGFRPMDAKKLAGDGPEFAAACRQSSKRPGQLLSGARRAHHGLTLLPLDWVSHAWQQAVDVFADVGKFPKRQVVRPAGPEGLIGYRGASHFNLHDLRFGSRPAAQSLACA